MNRNFKWAIKIGKEYLKGSTGEISSLLYMYHSDDNKTGDMKGMWKIRTTPHILEAKTWGINFKNYANRFVQVIGKGRVVKIRY